MKKLLLTAGTALVLAMSGMAYAHDDEHGGPPDGQPMHCEKAFSGLPQDKAQMFRTTMEQGHEKNKALMDQMHKLHEDLHEIITAPEFSREKFLAKSQELQELHAKMESRMTEGLASAFGQLSQDEREQVSEGMRLCHKDMHHHGKADEHKHKPAESDNPEPSGSGQ